ncbi:MAG: hypothetical protein ABI760_07925 [Ferruginibacter sp.]
MKIRIKGNSLRIRLSRSEVNKLAVESYLEEQTSFSNSSLVYALQASPAGDQLSADFNNNKITMFVPETLIKDWPVNTIVGFEATMPLTDTGTLYLLLEKDFMCFDATTEDQSDSYENPNKTC